MSSLRFTDRLANRAFGITGLALVALLLVAGCAGTSGTKPATDGTEEPLVREIAPEVMSQFGQATAILAAGDLVEAEFRFEEFILLYPGYPGAHTNLAIVHAANGDDEAAEASIQNALEIDPAFPPALNQLGMLMRRRGEFVQSAAAYEQALEADPSYALAHYNLGVLNELYLRRLDTALAHFEIYQSLTGADSQVEKWIVDLKRRLDAEQRAANVTE